MLVKYFTQRSQSNKKCFKNYGNGFKIMADSLNFYKNY